MSRFHSYINTAVKLAGLYKGDQPFAIFIKNFFSKEKKYGSQDRRQIAALCYNYFRLGFAMKNGTVEQKIKLATFLCEDEPGEFLEKMVPEWNEKIAWPADKKLDLVQDEFLITDIFPFASALSDAVSAKSYCRSMLVQPRFFLRIRPQCRLTTLKKLEKSKLDYQLIHQTCVQLPAATHAEDYFILDKEVVVQDYSSQRVLNYLSRHEAKLFAAQPEAVAVWDCCAASGGKSILLLDTVKRKIDLTISDIRPGIVMNLHQRFKKAGIKKYNYFIADAGDPEFSPPSTGYQLIICDAPCTGSGTWSRTPEQLCFFKPSDIKSFSDTQKRIVRNVVTHLAAGGIFVYITCSVFKEENESIAVFIEEILKLTLLHRQILEGFDRRADTMFVAVFKKDNP